MKKKYLIFAIFTIIVSALILTLIYLYAQAKEVSLQPIISGSTSNPEDNSSEASKFSLNIPNLGLNQGGTLEFETTDLPNNTTITEENSKITFENDSFELILSLGLGESGGLYDGMIKEVTIASGISGEVDRYKTTQGQLPIEELFNNTNSSYYFYTNMYAQCTIEVSFCGTAEISFNTVNDYNYQGHLKAYCNASEESVKFCDEILENLKLD